ncbi:hypothetical protein FOZ61_002060 [Perkinsus olseni]|uniref:Uncharacterized protein n=1 Tax=Perkinsus olseni TaxID=32597 RepID=A0A7J6LUN1_PEROL|nr:hypothetical protein FOL46_007529 [Perkinsus olseni]KAF4662924.1 hypothetical protein FOZ61_002060 [Perkinsus olseni]
MDLNRTANELRVKHEKSIEAAHREHGYKLDFSAYTLGHDLQYLGLNGKIQYAKPYANDSSNMQAVMNAPAYWSRVYYRGNIKDVDKETPDPGASKLGKSRSEAALKEADDSGGYCVIKARMKDFVQSYNKPALVWAPTSSKHTGERISQVDNGRLTFHNTLSHLKVTTFNDKGSALGAPGLISSRSCVDLFAASLTSAYYHGDDLRASSNPGRLSKVVKHEVSVPQNSAVAPSPVESDGLGPLTVGMAPNLAREYPQGTFQTEGESPKFTVSDMLGVTVPSSSSRIMATQLGEAPASQYGMTLEQCAQKVERTVGEFDTFKEGVGRLHSRVLQSEEALKKVEAKTEKYSSREANFAAELTKLFSLEQEVKTRAGVLSKWMADEKIVRDQLSKVYRDLDAKSLLQSDELLSMSTVLRAALSKMQAIHDHVSQVITAVGEAESSMYQWAYNVTSKVNYHTTQIVTLAQNLEFRITQSKGMETEARRMMALYQKLADKYGLQNDLFAVARSVLKTDGNKLQSTSVSDAVHAPPPLSSSPATTTATTGITV